MEDVNSRTVYRSFVSAIRTFYEDGPRFVLVSVLWFVCSVPVVTVGPATLGAYTAVASLREGYTIDSERVVSVVKRHGVSSVLLTGVPLILAVGSILYAREYLINQSVALLVLCVGTAYAAVYTGLVLVPTFVGLATGEDLGSALRNGFRWTASNATGVATIAMASLVTFIVTAVLTIAFALVFGGLIAAFHLEVLGTDTADSETDTSSMYASGSETTK